VIQGVRIKPLRVLADERGFLMEILREDDEIFQRFGQVYMTGCRYGTAKAWHSHRQQTDHFVCVAGKALLVLYDARETSPSRGQVQEIALAAPGWPPRDPSHTPLLVQIPPLVLHGFTALEENEARILNVPTHPYRHSDPDELRQPWNSTQIPFRWPDFVIGGG
jgi:dTDP-4-dehydrorhamnose 3,5-epimerase